jgi:hypothetical protein
MRCPSASCDYQAYINRDSKLFDCVKCRHAYCLRCMKPCGASHYPCGPVRKEDHGALLRRLGFKACPKCGEGLQKEAGCNFVKCPSAHCRGHTYFCWLCKELLTIESHYSHFPSGPFADKCLAEIPAEAPPVPYSSSSPGSGAQGPCLEYRCSCFMCFRSTRLLCGHSLCNSCFKDYIADLLQLKGFQETSLVCPLCPCPIVLEEFFKVFGGKEGYVKFKSSILVSAVEVAEKFASPHLCPVCSAQLTNEEGMWFVVCYSQRCQGTTIACWGCLGLVVCCRRKQPIGFSRL